MSTTVVTVTHSQYSNIRCLLLSQTFDFLWVPLAVMVYTCTDINSCSGSSYDIAMLQLLELGRLTLESLVVLLFKATFLPNLTPTRHVLAALESMSSMATQWVHVGRRVATHKDAGQERGNK